jgi:hypothetical protein
VVPEQHLEARKKEDGRRKRKKKKGERERKYTRSGQRAGGRGIRKKGGNKRAADERPAKNGEMPDQWWGQ